MEPTDNILTIAYLNIHGQSKLPENKQVQIEEILKFYKIDVAHLQEIEICDESFSKCNFITSSYNIISNNAANKFGTSSLVKSVFTADNIQFDTAGRAIVFDLGDLTLGNFYAQSGTDARSRSSREGFLAEVVPQLLTNRKLMGCVGGDWNCIVEKSDATVNPETKTSNTLKRVIKAFDMSDSFRTLHPKVKSFSRYYSDTRGQGASRIDRQYHFGNITILEAKYIPLAFSDHHGLIVKISLPDSLSRIFCPRGRQSFRLQDNVIQNLKFKQDLSDAMIHWKNIKDFGMDTLVWWEQVVKPGVKRLGMVRGRELMKESRGELNLLLVRQAYLNKKVKLGKIEKLAELKTVHKLIQNWYEKECSKIKDQSRATEFQESEKVTIYHHEIHKKMIRKSSILKLQTPTGLLEGHKDCANFLEKEVQNLLLTDAGLDHAAQVALLDEISPCFSEADNAILLAPPTIQDVKDTVTSSNLHAAPGTDGLPSFFYKECWDTMGGPLTEVMTDIFHCKPLTSSQRTSLMVFGSKPKKTNSLLPQDKRRISLLNSDFKVGSGLEARRLKKTLTHTLSPLQLVAGNDRRIHHGINLARDAIWAAGKRGQGCGILDTDLIAGFDYMNLTWCLKVLEMKGAAPAFLKRLVNLYSNNISVVVVNNTAGAAVQNIRLTLRQGDIPSMELFCFGIDPLIFRLERVLQGILIASVPVHGPTLQHQPSLPPLEQRYKLIGYADDNKPAITTMEEFTIVDNSLAIFERASGCRLHRDPLNKKCKFLPLGRWRNSLQQTDIPCNYMTISDHLDMVGVTLTASWSKTRKVNGDALQLCVKNTIQPWKAGKFLPVTQRGWSINSYALSKVWFRTRCIDLRVCDIKSITSSIKSWLYQDMLVKPEEMVLHRPHLHGGLCLHSVKNKALAGFITTFLQTAANPAYQTNLLHSVLYRKYILEEENVPGVPAQPPPYFTQDLFTLIRTVMTQTPLNIITMTERDWTRLLTEDNSTMEINQVTGLSQYRPCKAEEENPTTDWQLSWSLCRQTGIPPHLASFLWKLLLNLLCTQERLHKMKTAPSPLCKLCNQSTPGTLQHTFFQCEFNCGVGLLLLDCLQNHTPGLTASTLLRLELTNLEEEMTLPCTLLTAITLNFIWSHRMSNSKFRAYQVRSEIEQTINLLRTSRLIEVSAKLQALLNQMFQ